MENFGLLHLWSGGDFLTHSVALFLLLMSMISWVVILVKSRDSLRLRKMAENAEKNFWFAGDYNAALTSLIHGEDNPFLHLAKTAQEAHAHGTSAPQLHQKMNSSDWITRCLKNEIDESISQMQSGLAILASIGSTAPFVGLFGTVWGIYHALIGLSTGGAATIDKVAGPVGEALIMTALGLGVAIPAVLGYNALTRTNKRVIGRLNRFANDLHAYFVTGSRLNKGR